LNGKPLPNGPNRNKERALQGGGSVLTIDSSRYAVPAHLMFQISKIRGNGTLPCRSVNPAVWSVTLCEKLGQWNRCTLMGTYYGLEIVAGIHRQIFFCEKGLPPSEFLTLFRSSDRAYPSFPSGFEDSDEPYIPSHAYLVPVPRLVERLEVMGFTLAALNCEVKRCLKSELAELARRIEDLGGHPKPAIGGHLKTGQRDS
jgi:hypothetical protein